MTTSLFSQLISELGGDLGPSGIQKMILDQADSGRSMAQRAGLVLYWNNVAASTAASGSKVDPTTVMAVMAGLPEMQDMTDFFFI